MTVKMQKFFVTVGFMLIGIICYPFFVVLEMLRVPMFVFEVGKESLQSKIRQMHRAIDYDEKVKQVLKRSMSMRRRSNPNDDEAAYRAQNYR